MEVTSALSTFMLCETTGDAATIVAASGDHKEAAARLAAAIEQITSERITVATNLMMAFFSGAKRFVLLATPAEILKIAAFIKEDETRRRIETLATTPLGKDACAFQLIQVKDFRVLLAIGMTAREVDFAATDIAAAMALDEYEDLAVTIQETTLRPRVALRALALSHESAASLSAGDLRALRLTHVIAPPGTLLDESKMIGLKTYLRAGDDVDLQAAESCDGIAVLPGDHLTVDSFQQSLAAFAPDNPGCELLLPADDAFDELSARAETAFFFDCKRLSPPDAPRKNAWPLLTQSDAGGLAGALLRHNGDAFVAAVDRDLSPIEAAAVQIVPWRDANAVPDALFTAIVHARDASTRNTAARLFKAVADNDSQNLEAAVQQFRAGAASQNKDRPEGLLEILRWSDTMSPGAEP